MTGRGQDDIERMLALELRGRAYDPLPAAEVEELVRQAQMGDIQARNRVVETHLRLVSKYARALMGKGVPFMDLFQEGILALMACIQKYDPYFKGRTQRMPFVIIATIYLKKHMRRVIYRELLNPGRIRNPNKSDRATDYNDRTIEKMLMMREAQRAAEPQTQREFLWGIREAMTTLTPTQRKIIALHYGIYDLYERDARTISRVLAIPETEVKKQMTLALNTLKETLRERVPTPYQTPLPPQKPRPQDAAWVHMPKHPLSQTSSP